MRTLLEGGSFFESPRWHDGRWWVSDFFRGVVLAVDGRGRAEEIARVEAQPSGLGWLPDGSLLVVSMRDRRVLRQADGALHVYADLAELCDWHANDMVVASDGRAYVGNFGFDLDGEEPMPTNVVRVDPDGSACVAADRLLFPNGSVITPDGQTLIVGETFGRRYTAFTIAAGGSLVERRVWADLSSARIAPTAAPSTQRAASGPPMPHTSDAAGSPRVGRSSRKSSCGRACAASRACSAETTDARCCCAARRTTMRGAEASHGTPSC
jgi:sugar lactone lactonase YvrE